MRATTTVVGRRWVAGVLCFAVFCSSFPLQAKVENCPPLRSAMRRFGERVVGRPQPNKPSRYSDLQADLLHQKLVEYAKDLLIRSKVASVLAKNKVSKKSKMTVQEAATFVKDWANALEKSSQRLRELSQETNRTELTLSTPEEVMRYEIQRAVAYRFLETIVKKIPEKEITELEAKQARDQASAHDPQSLPELTDRDQAFLAARAALEKPENEPNPTYMKYVKDLEKDARVIYMNGLSKGWHSANKHIQASFSKTFKGTKEVITFLAVVGFIATVSSRISSKGFVAGIEDLVLSQSDTGILRKAVMDGAYDDDEFIEKLSAYLKKRYGDTSLLAVIMHKNGEIDLINHPPAWVLSLSYHRDMIADWQDLEAFWEIKREVRLAIEDGFASYQRKYFAKVDEKDFTASMDQVATATKPSATTTRAELDLKNEINTFLSEFYEGHNWDTLKKYRGTIKNVLSVENPDEREVILEQLLKESDSRELVNSVRTLLTKKDLMTKERIRQQAFAREKQRQQEELEQKKKATTQPVKLPPSTQPAGKPALRP